MIHILNWLKHDDIATITKEGMKKPGLNSSLCVHEVTAAQF